MAQIGSLTVDLIAQTAAFNANISRAAKNLNSEAARMQKSLQQIESAASFTSNGIKALASAFLVTEGLRIGGAALDYAAGLGEVSQQLGVTIEDLQVYRYAATQVGVSQEEMEKGLGKFTQTLGKAQLGSKTSAEIFDRLNVKIRDSSGQVLNASQVLPRLADAIAKIPDPTKRAAVEVALFGRAGQQLDTLLSGGSAAIGEMRDTAKSLGIVLEDDLVPAADAAADKIAEMKMQLEANISRAVAQNAGSILSLANALTSLTIESIKFINEWPKLSAALAGAAAGARAGVIGAGIGAVAGYALGDEFSKSAIDANMDVAFRKKQLAEAVANLKDFKKQANATGSDGLFGVRRAPGAIGGDERSYVSEVERQSRLLNRAAATARSRAPKTIPPSATLESSALDGLMAGGGGSSKKKTGLSDAEKLTAEYEKWTKEQEQQLQLQTLRQQGYAYEADLLESRWDLEQKFPKLDEDRLTKAWDIQHAIIAQNQGYEEMAELLRSGLDTPLQISDLTPSVGGMSEASRVALDYQKMLADLGINTNAQTRKISESWDAMAHDILYSLEDITRGIQGGNVFGVLNGLLGLFSQLGSFGVFGKGIQGNLNASKALPGHKNGGFTGWGGVGEIAGYVHGREFVFDAQSTAAIGVPNLEAMRRGYRGGGYVGATSVGGYLNRPGGGLRVQVVKGDMFDVIVDQRAGAVAAPMVVAGSQAASADAQKTIARRTSRRMV